MADSETITTLAMDYFKTLDISGKTPKEIIRIFNDILNQMNEEDKLERRESKMVTDYR